MDREFDASAGLLALHLAMATMALLRDKGLISREETHALMEQSAAASGVAITVDLDQVFPPTKH